MVKSCELQLMIDRLFTQNDNNYPNNTASIFPNLNCLTKCGYYNQKWSTWTHSLVEKYTESKEPFEMTIAGGTVLFAAVIAILTSPTVQDDSLKITAYFESLCPDSISFMMEQLAPLMGEFNRYPDWLTLDLVPFGFENITSSGDTCQHGTKECQGNKVYACVIDQLVTEQETPLNIRLMNFIYCVMNAGSNPLKAAKKCAAQTEVNYKKLMKCYNGATGDSLIKMYGERTAALVPTLSWVPTIVLNDVFNETQSDLAQTDLYSLVCSLVPDQC